MRIATTLFLAALLSSCAIYALDREGVVVHIDPETNPWTNLDLNNDPDNFQFAIVSDRTGGHRPGVFEDAITKLNLLQPEFVMSVGDLIEGYSDNRTALEDQWTEFDGFVHKLEMPFFYVPGNHDISNETMHELWEERLGRPYYHFVYRDVLFLCLNTEDPPASHISDGQVDYVRQALEENADVRWTLVFMHKPLYDEKEGTGWEKVEALLEGRNYNVFAGHRHSYMKSTRNDQRYIMLATTGGSSQLRGPQFGEFDHVMWITMTPEGPRIANLMLDGIWDDNIRTKEFAALIQPALYGNVVRAGHILAEAATFQQGATQVRLTNDADVPMTVTLNWRPVEGMSMSPSRIEKTVPPNSVEVVDSALHLDGPRQATDMAPLAADWTVQYERVDDAPVTVTGTERLIVDARSFPIQRKSGILVDGALQEWEPLTFNALQPGAVGSREDLWTGPADSSFAFDVAQDDENLFVAVNVVDEALVRTQDPRPARQDSVEVWLDARPVETRGVMTDTKEMEQYLLLSVTPPDSDGNVAVGNPEAWPEGAQSAARTTENGYAIEISVPLAWVIAQQDGTWESVRINVAISDYDDRTGGRTVVSWRPDWKSGRNYKESGNFTR